MMFKCTKLIERALEQSRDEVKNIKGLLVTDEFLMFTLFKEAQYQIIGKLLSTNNFNIFTLRYYIDNRNNILMSNGYLMDEVEEELSESFDVGLSDETIDTLQRAEDFVTLAGKEEIDSACLVLALLESENIILTNYLADYEIDIDAIKKGCIEYLCTGKIADQDSKSDDRRSSKPKRLDKIIEETCTDLTQQALDGEIDPIIGREREIEAIINTMARRSKNNVLLVGEPGIGKTAIIKGLALKLANNEVPSLANKRIYSLSIGSLMSNSMYRGQLEQRVTELMASLSKLGNAILFIDELHLIMKSGGSKDSNVDISSLLKQELGMRKLQLIGCTTTKEVRQIQEDPAFMRRLNVITLQEPNEEEAFDIMKGLNYRYEDFHHIEIPDDTLKVAIRLAKRYVAERFLPDSAIDVIDSAGAKLKLKMSAKTMSKKKQIEIDIESIQMKIMKETDVGTGIELYRKLKELKELLDDINKGDFKEEPEKPVLTPDDIANEIEVRTGIPVSRLMASDKAKLLSLENDMHKHIVGQEAAINEICNAIRRNSSGLSNPDKPIASFLFAGPTGVGKTEVCKALAELRYGSKDNMIRIDCSEYSESYSISKLIGSAPGYVGSDKGGQLTEAVRHKPYSVVLFDEFEKAKGNLTNILLQILDDGRLTDSQGVTVSFKNCIIVLTTNLGSGLLSQSRTVGFGSNDADEMDKSEYEQLKDKTMEAIKNNLSPEFINRLSATVVFHPLNQEHQRQIIRLLGKKIDTRLAEQDIVAKCTDAALDFIADNYFDKQYGARPLERGLVKLIEEPLSILLLEDKVQPGDFVQIDLVDNELKFEVISQVEEA